MQKDLIKKIKKLKLKLSTVESLTGGGLAYFFTAIPGSSKFFDRAYVTYSNESKIDIGVNPDSIKNFGSISKVVAKEMAQAATDENTIAISLTGNAGPKSIEGKEIGQVFIGVAHQDKFHVEEYNFGKVAREEIRMGSIAAAIEVLEKFLD